jgi:hypothetical protein
VTALAHQFARLIGPLHRLSLRLSRFKGSRGRYPRAGRASRPLRGHKSTHHRGGRRAKSRGLYGRGAAQVNATGGRPKRRCHGRFHNPVTSARPDRLAPSNAGDAAAWRSRLPIFRLWWRPPRPRQSG